MGDEGFDYVLSWNVIFHGTMGDVGRRLAEIWRVLKPGGLYQGTMLSKRDAQFGLGRPVAPDTFVRGSEAKAHPHYYCDLAGLARSSPASIFCRLWAVRPKRNTSKRHPGHKVYPYLLRGKTIDRANQVWAADITYIPMRQGFLYLVAIIDWATRRVLSWRLSNTLTAGFCVEALSEALARFGKPDIFNTDQGAQFTSEEFTNVLRDHRIEISMDGRGRCHDNIFVERLWWTVKQAQKPRRQVRFKRPGCGLNRRPDPR